MRGECVLGVTNNMPKFMTTQEGPPPKEDAGGEPLRLVSCRRADDPQPDSVLLGDVAGDGAFDTVVSHQLDTMTTTALTANGFPCGDRRAACRYDAGHTSAGPPSDLNGEAPLDIVV